MSNSDRSDGAVFVVYFDFADLLYELEVVDDPAEDSVDWSVRLRMIDQLAERSSTRG